MDYGLWEDPFEQVDPESLPKDYRVRLDRLEQVDSASRKEEWRYHVVAFRGNNGILKELSTAFDLSHIELEVGFTISHLDLGGGTQ